jgi:replicative DNA helicase
MLEELNFSHLASSLPPQNIDAEESILGGILLDPEAIGRVADLLSPEAFYISAHKEIYKAALALYNQDKPTDLMIVTSWLYDCGLLDKVGGQSKLAQLVERTVSAVNIDRYAELVMDKYQRRRLIQAGNQIVELGYETATELPTVINAAEESLFNVTCSKAQDKFQSMPISDVLIDTFKNIELGKVPGHPTGLLDLDTLIGGLHRQDMIVVAGRAGMGKTWFGCYLADYFARVHQLPVVFFSAEMDRQKLAKRFLAMHSGINLKRLIGNEIFENEWEPLSRALGVLSSSPLIINDTPASQLTPIKIRSELRQIKMSLRNETNPDPQLGLVVLDYIQKLGDRTAFNRAQQVGAYAGEIKDIAKEFDVPFIEPI